MSDQLSVVTIARVIGSRLDPLLAESLHEAEHDGRVEWVHLSTADVARRRLRVVTDRGTECMIALPRSESLYDGAVLMMAPDRAIVLRVLEESWLRLRPASPAGALRLGYSAGNLHWRVRFSGTDLEIALEGPRDGYLARLGDLLAEDAVALVDEAAAR